MFDEYVMELVYGGRYTSSDYAAAFAELNGQESSAFVREAFAEDFWFFLTYPNRIAATRREFFEKIVRATYPEIDIEQLRHKIRLANIALFGKKPVNWHFRATCDTVRHYTRKKNLRNEGKTDFSKL